MSLSAKETKALRTIGHKLNPIVIISTRLNENIRNEIERALNDHELIKIRVNVPEREDRTELVNELSAAHHAEVVQFIGKIALFYRKAKKQNLKLSNLVRHRNLLDS
jgi:RNA-binding protein